MFRRGFFVRALGIILLLVLLIGGGYSIHRAGVAQGYALGLQTAGVEPGSLPEGVPDQFMPPIPYRVYGGYGYGPGFHPFFGGFGFVFPLFFGLLFFFFITRLIFRPFWGWGGPHGYGKYPGGPPWAKDWEKGEKGAEQSEQKPDKEAGS